MKILVSYRGAQKIRSWETGSMIADAFRRFGHEVDEYGHVFETKESITSSTYSGNKYYDLILICEANDPDPQYWQLLGQPCGLRVYWTFDTSYKVNHELSVIKQFQPHHVFCANWYLTSVVEDLLRTKTTFLPYACCPQRHFREYDSQRKVRDIALIGSERPDRMRLIQALKDRKFDAHLISNVFKEDYIDELASTRIIVNENPVAGKGLINMRHSEGFAAGSFVINQLGDGIEQIMPQKYMRWCYNSLDDLSNICYELLDTECFLVEPTIKWQEYILKNHTYDNRAKQILDTLGT